MYVGIKDAIFEPSNALRCACEQIKVLEMEGLVNRAIQMDLADGGPEHRLRNGSVQISKIAYFCETKPDIYVAMNTCPGHSWRSPAERVMPVLNIAFGNVSLCRSKMQREEDEAYIH